MSPASGRAWKDTPQQEAILRQNKAARRTRSRFPSGTKIVSDPGGMKGEVLRHIPSMNAQGGSLRIKWENGRESLASPVSVKRATSTAAGESIKKLDKAPPTEVVQPQDWKMPPPPVGKSGVSKAGGYSSDAAYGTNTALGRVGEEAFTKIMGGRIIHPPGHGEQSPLDVHYDGLGFEVKAVSTKTIGYKATPKPFEIDQKQKFADDMGIKPAIAIVVVDSDKKKAHAYYREGLKGGRLSQNTGWQYLGSTDL